MKILLVNKFHYRKGGSETYYFTLADTLTNLGHEVIFFAMNDDKNLPCDQQKYFVENRGVNSGAVGKIKYILSMNYSKEAYKKMKQLIIDEKPDLAILNLVHKQLTLSVVKALKESNIKMIWTMHDLIAVCPSYTMLDGNNNVCEKCLTEGFKACTNNRCIKGSKLMSILSTREAKFIAKKGWYNDVDLYVCPSNFYKNKLEEGKFTKSKITYLRNPLPIDTKYEIKDAKDYILYFGRLSYEKGVPTLIEAMKQVNYKLIILGTGPIEEELKQKIKDENLESKVSMLGFKIGQELKDIVSQSKCVILPSEWYENGPYSAMEAMASGRPLIVSNMGGLPELVVEEKNGYIFESKDVNSLVSKINKMISLSEEDYNSMCNESLEFAKKSFDPINYCNELLKMIK